MAVHVPADVGGVGTRPGLERNERNRAGLPGGFSSECNELCLEYGATKESDVSILNATSCRLKKVSFLS